MNRRFNIYCEFGFLEAFAKICPDSLDRDLKHWHNYHTMLCENGDLILTDINNDDFKSHCDGNTRLSLILQPLFTSYADGIRNLICLPTEKKNMEIKEEDGDGNEYFGDHEQTIFLLNRDNTECKIKEENYGLMFISPDPKTLFERAELLFTPQRREVTENIKNWDFVKEYKHPCNSIHLIDNYILGKDENDLKRDIESLFDALLPKKLDKTSFEVNISTGIPEKQDEAWANRQAKKIKSWIIELRKEYEIKVSVRYIKNNNHDRNLITNYYLFDCGYGFVLSDSQRKTGTKLTVFSITHPSTPTIMQNLKEKYLK